MAHYGSFRYGDGTLYGTDDPVTQITYNGELIWVINIGWAGDSFDGTNEASIDNIALEDVRISRGTKYYIKSNGRGLEPMEVGKAVLKFYDPSRRYDPYNTASPLYPNVNPGRLIQISVLVIETGIRSVLFTGNITDIQPSSHLDTVTITAQDAFGWFSRANYATSAIYTTTISSAINRVLSIVGWKGQKRITSSAQPLQVFEPGDGDALSILNQLSEANLGTLFIDRAGALTYYPYNYNSMPSHSIDEDILLNEIRTPQPWETVCNEIRVIANRRGKRPSIAIWQETAVEHFDIGETKEFGASYKQSVDINTTSIKANYNANGSGGDASGFFSVVLSDITTTSCTVTVSNNSGAVAYMNYLSVLGREIVSAPIIIKQSDTTSIGRYGARRFILDNAWLMDKGYATAMAGWLKSFLKDPQINPTVMIQQRVSDQFDIELMDKIVLNAPTRSISDTFYIRGIEYEWLADTGQSVLTTIYLAKVLYNATVPTPDPYYPGLPDLPDLPDPYNPNPYVIPPTDPYPPPNTNDCILANAPANGPFTLFSNYNMGILQTGQTEEIFIPYMCTLRPGSSINKSHIQFRGMFYELGSNSQWHTDVDNDWLQVTAVDANKAPLVAGTITTQEAISQGDTRVVTFTPASEMPVAGFVLKLLAEQLATGELVASGTVQANNDTGITLSGLTVGGQYCLTTSGGRWYNYGAGSPDYWLYTYCLYNGVGWFYLGGMARQGGAEYYNIGDSMGGAVFPIAGYGIDGVIQPYNTNYSRVYFTAVADIVRFRVGDYGFFDNDGSLSCSINVVNAYAQHYAKIELGKIFNICGA